MSEKNEAIFDQLENRFEAINSGYDNDADSRATNAAKSEHGESASKNEIEGAGISIFDGHAYELRLSVENLFAAIKMDMTYSNSAIKSLKEKLQNYEDHIRHERGNATVDQWIRSV